MARAYLQDHEQEWEPESDPECPEHHHHVPSTDDTHSLPKGRSLVGGRSAVLGEGDDGRDKEVGLLCGDPTSESVGHRALALPSEGSRVGPLLSRRSLGLGGEEGRGESRVGHSSIDGHRG